MPVWAIIKPIVLYNNLLVQAGNKFFFTVKTKHEN